MLLAKTVCFSEDVDEQALESCGVNINPIMKRYASILENYLNKCYLSILNECRNKVYTKELIIEEKDYIIKMLQKIDEDGKDPSNVSKGIVKLIKELKSELEVTKNELSECKKKHDDKMQTCLNALKDKDASIIRIQEELQNKKKELCELLKNKMDKGKASESIVKENKQNKETISSLGDPSDVNDSKLSLSSKNVQIIALIKDLRKKLKFDCRNTLSSSKVCTKKSVPIQNYDEFTYSNGSFNKSYKEILIKKLLECNKVQHDRHRKRAGENSDEENDGDLA